MSDNAYTSLDEPPRLAEGFPRVIRRETSAAHLRLEDSLALSASTATHARILALLKGLHGFYLAWEPWLARSPLDSSFLAERSKLDLTGRDLSALGVHDAHNLPRYPFPLGPATLERAMGSIYVIEGSTLGSQIIRRWLANVPWRPVNGFAYFDSYGERVGPMWRAFQDRLSHIAGTGDRHAIVDAANDTFARLEQWLSGKIR